MTGGGETTTFVELCEGDSFDTTTLGFKDVFVSLVVRGLEGAVTDGDKDVELKEFDVSEGDKG